MDSKEGPVRTRKVSWLLNGDRDSGDATTQTGMSKKKLRKARERPNTTAANRRCQNGMDGTASPGGTGGGEMRGLGDNTRTMLRTMEERREEKKSQSRMKR